MNKLLSHSDVAKLTPYISDPVMEYDVVCALLEGYDVKSIISCIQQNKPLITLTYPIETLIEDGLLQCRKCQSLKIKAESKQLKSSDEGMSVIAHCTTCGHNWVEHG